MKSKALILFLSLFLFSCQNNPESAKVDTQGHANHDGHEHQKTADIDFSKGSPEEIATAMCKCLTPSLEIYNKQIKLAKAKDSKALKALMEDQNKIAAEADKCIDSLEASFGHVDEAKEKQIAEAMSRSCSKIADMMNEME